MQTERESIPGPGGTPLYLSRAVHGESFYQAAISEIAGGKKERGHQLRCVAALRPEPKNKFDPNAVQVFIQGQLVGYLARPLAETWSPALRRRGKYECPADIVGGWDDSDRDTGLFGVDLWLPDFPADLTPRAKIPASAIKELPVTSAAPATTIVDTRSGPNMLIRILWFLCVGWWLSFLWITLASLVSLTILGIPLGIWMCNRVPQVVTLKMDSVRLVHTTGADGSSTVTLTGVAQRPFWQRALWYLLVGWWLTTIWLYLAWLLCITILLVPVAFPMFTVTGKLLTLKRG